jgi:Bifunctional DNA primase/polymerase, N-terminal
MESDGHKRIASDVTGNTVLTVIPALAGPGVWWIPTWPDSKRAVRHPVRARKGIPLGREDGSSWRPEYLEPVRSGRCGAAILPGLSHLACLDTDVSSEPAPAGDGSYRLAGVSGAEQLAGLCREAGVTLPPTVTTRTRSGGRHFWFRQRPDRPLRTCIRIDDGVLIDIKASGIVVECPTPGYAPAIRQRQ